MRPTPDESSSGEVIKVVSSASIRHAAAERRKVFDEEMANEEKKALEDFKQQLRNVVLNSSS